MNHVAADAIPRIDSRIEIARPGHMPQMLSSLPLGGRRIFSIGVGVLALLAIAACGDTASTDVSDAATSSGDGGSSPDDASMSDDGAPATSDAAAAPRNASCTPLSQQNGTAVSTSYGRLDGTLVFVVGIGQGRSCNGDDNHVHLQVEVSGEVYDVAVDIGATNDEVGLYETSIEVPGGAWSEGWHGSDAFAYPGLGVHSSSLPLEAPKQVGTELESLLTSTSKISIFCTGYSQGNGCHDVHYTNGSGRDGAIVLDPTSTTSPVLFFRFSTQSF